MKNTYDTTRIIAENHFLSNDSRATGINNNDLIIGPSGSGKTRSYVKPNIMQANGSMVIADTKGNLAEEMRPLLEKHGYDVKIIDFKQMKTNCRYNPMDYIRHDEKNQRYSEDDIKKLADALCPIQSEKDPFWDHASALQLCFLTSYVLDFLPEEEHSLKYVLELFRKMPTSAFEAIMEDALARYPESTAAKYYEQIKYNRETKVTDASIHTVLSEHLHGVTMESALAMYTHPVQFRFRDLGKKKTALFVNISDTDRSMDSLIGLFYVQAFQDLFDFADHDCKDERLPVPVRFILDDFATNIKIADFDNIISVIRSREIYVSVILQSIAQLSALYGDYRANTIIDDCDTLLYLGGHSLETVKYIATRADVPENTILNLPMDEAYLFVSGRKPEKVRKFDLTKHESYGELPEAQKAENLEEEELDEDRTDTIGRAF